MVATSVNQRFSVLDLEDVSLTAGELNALQGAPGTTYWVDSVNGSDVAANTGVKDSPFRTITAALAKCVNNKGDQIIVKPNSTWTYGAAAGVAINKVGVSIVGQGRGTNRPKIILDTATTASLTVTAANVRIDNFVFEAAFADVAQCFTVTAAEFHINACEFVEQATDENWVNIVDCSSGTAQTAKGLTITNCRMTGVDAATAAFITTAAEIDNLTFTGNYVARGANAAVLVLTAETAGDLFLGLNISDNNLQSKAAAHTGNLLLSDCTGATNTGIIARNMIGHLTTTGAPGTELTGASWFENYNTGAVDKSGFLLPAVDS